jgi:hypothetical protein
MGLGGEQGHPCWRTRRQARHLVDDCMVDRRGVGAVFRGRADPLVKELATFEAPTIAYIWIGILTFTTLRPRRTYARAGMRLHVPVAAHPGGIDGRVGPQRYLSARSRRAAHLTQESSRAARQGTAGRGLCRLQPMRCRLPPAERSSGSPFGQLAARTWSMQSSGMVHVIDDDDALRESLLFLLGAAKFARVSTRRPRRSWLT